MSDFRQGRIKRWAKRRMWGVMPDSYPQIVQQERHILLIHFFRLRFWILIIPVVFLGAFLLWEPVVWKLVLIASAAVLLLGFSLLEYRRALQQPIGPATIQINFWFMLSIQSVVIFVTGGIESPLIIIYIPLCLGVGLLLGELRRVLPVILLPVAMVLLFASGCLYGWIPQTTPAFFELGQGWVNKPVYVWTTASVIVLLLVVSSSTAVYMRKILDEKMQKTFDARESELRLLSQRNKEIVSVSATIAHELKNPLASIKGLTQLLAQGKNLTPKQHERLQVMQHEIERMQTVLNEFRNFSRPLSALTPESVDLSNLVEGVLLLHEGLAERQQVQLELKIQSSLTIVCDAVKIKQALTNLVLNALQATGTQGRVVVRLNQTDSGARVEVEDNGVGLSEESQRRWAEAGYTTKTSGSGIGLAWSKSIVDQHGGSLSLTNLQSRGCLAVMSLPKQPRQPAQELP